MKSNSNISISELESIASQMRGTIVELSHKAKSAHLGSALSSVDIMTALYWTTLKIDPQKPDDPNRDRLIFSKGHAAMSLYTTLAYQGFFSFDFLNTYTHPGTPLAEHPMVGAAPGIEATTGSLGHGLPMAVGIALAERIQKRDYRVFVVMSDGECNEGSIWEAALLAPAQNLEKLTVVVDYNKWQATGRSNEVMALSPLRKKWEAFGWSSYEVDGHNMEELVEVLKEIPDGSGKPVAIVANTIKGKGVSFMEDDNNWHYRIPVAEEVTKAKMELGLL